MLESNRARWPNRLTSYTFSDDSQQQKRVAVKKEMAENAEESKSEKKDRIHHEADESNQVKQHSLSENSVSQPKCELFIDSRKIVITMIYLCNVFS